MRFSSIFVLSIVAISAIIQTNRAEAQTVNPIPTASVHAKDVTEIHYNQASARLRLIKDKEIHILDNIQHDTGKAVDRCLSAASDILGGKMPVTQVSFFIDVLGGMTGQFDNLGNSTVTYHGVRIRNCTMKK